MLSLSQHGAEGWNSRRLAGRRPGMDRRGTGGFVRGVVAAVLALGLIPRGALAADVIVTKTADTNDGVCDADCSLREAIDTANANDTIVIPQGIFTVGSEIAIDKALTLQGEGAFDTIIQAAAVPGIAGHRIFNFGTMTFNVALFDLTIRHGTVFGGDGGAMLATGGSGNLEITRCHVVFNEANADGPVNGGAASGGAIAYFSSGMLIISDSAIADNRISANGATGVGGAASGGAIFSGPITLIRSGVVRNTISVLGPVANGAASGGALFVSSSIVTNSTLSDNGCRAGAASGGALFTGPAVVSSSTLTGNFLIASARSGAAIFGSATMRNSIVADNTPSNCFTLTSAGYNLIDDGDGCGFTAAAGDQIGTAVAPIDPRLGPLALNGATTETRALLADSPAIEAGNPAGCVDNNATLLTTDQRGFIRPFDGDFDGTAICDIGAFEFRPIASTAPALGWVGLLALGAALVGFGLRRLVAA